MYTRRLHNLLTALSLLLLVAVAALWVRSYFVGDTWTLPYDRVVDVTTSPYGETDTWRAQYVLNSGRGRAQWVRTECTDDAVAPAGHSTLPVPQTILDLRSNTPGDWWTGALGFDYFVREKHYVHGPRGNHSTYFGFRTLTVPYWFLASVSGALAAAGVFRYLRQRRRRVRIARGLCRTCGYDIRATLDRCPECGTTPARMAG